MGALAILALVEKGMMIISALIEAGKSAAPAIEAVTNLVKNGQAGEVSEEDLDKTEALLDSLIDEFNLDLPEA